MHDLIARLPENLKGSFVVHESKFLQSSQIFSIATMVIYQWCTSQIFIVVKPLDPHPLF